MKPVTVEYTQFSRNNSCKTAREVWVAYRDNEDWYVKVNTYLKKYGEGFDYSIKALLIYTEDETLYAWHREEPDGPIFIDVDWPVAESLIKKTPLEIL